MQSNLPLVIKIPYQTAKPLAKTKLTSAFCTLVVPWVRLALSTLLELSDESKVTAFTGVLKPPIGVSLAEAEAL